MKLPLFALVVLLLVICFCGVLLSQVKENRSAPHGCYPILGAGNHKLGYIDGNGKLRILPRYVIDLESIESMFFNFGFSEKLAVVAGAESDFNREYINCDGKTTVAGKFENARKFSEGLAAVVLKDGSKWGFIDNIGSVVISPKYSEVKNFSEGLAAVTEDGKGWGFIDRSGKVVIDPKYNEASDFSEGLAAVKSPNGKLWFLDKQGNVALTTNFQFSDFTDSVTDSYLRSLNKLNAAPYALMDEAESIKFPTDSNKRLGDSPRFSGGLFPIKVKKKWGYINKEGKRAIAYKYDVAGNFNDRLARVRLGKKYGFIDSSGAFAIQPTFAFVSDFSDGMALVIFTFTARDVSGLDVHIGNYEDGSRRITIRYGYIDKGGHSVFRGTHVFDASIFGGDVNSGFTLPYEVGVSILSNSPNSNVYFVPSVEARNFNYDDVNGLNTCCWLGETDAEGTVTAERPLGNYFVVIINQGRRSAPKKVVLSEDSEKNKFRVSLD